MSDCVHLHHFRTLAWRGRAASPGTALIEDEVAVCVGCRTLVNRYTVTTRPHREIEALWRCFIPQPVQPSFCLASNDN